MIHGEGPTLQDIFAARRRLQKYLHPTPLLHSEWLSSLADANVHLKIESAQLAHSFKIRGAFNSLLSVRDARKAQRSREMCGDVDDSKAPVIVTASAGNHGRAIALAAERLGLQAIVFTPATAPETKKAAIRRHGAELRDDPPDYDTAEQRARDYAKVEGATYISPYNHRDVIAGAGTIALEILESFPSLDTLVVPVGGGGLISGLALAMKSAAPHVSVVGVEVDASRPFAIGIERGAITEIDAKHSLADGLTGNLEPGSITFELVRRHVDHLVSVGEDELERAVRGLATEEHLIAEGAGATATAAVVARKAVQPGDRAVVMMTGGNIDVATLARILR